MSFFEDGEGILALESRFSAMQCFSVIVFKGLQIGQCIGGYISKSQDYSS